jgi:hypothetical protein
MPFSFTILGPGAVLILIGAIMVVNLLKKVFGHHNSH